MSTSTTPSTVSYPNCMSCSNALPTYIEMTCQVTSSISLFILLIFGLVSARFALSILLYCISIQLLEAERISQESINLILRFI
jgi:hypothetical protein